MSANSTVNSPLAFCDMFLTVFVAEPVKVFADCLSFLFVKEDSIPATDSLI